MKRGAEARTEGGEHEAREPERPARDRTPTERVTEAQ